jgi:hypothetical protein
LICLQLWESTPGDKLISAYEVWRGSLSDPNYAAKLKDFFGDTFRGDTPESYNFTYPNRFLPRFEEDTNDLELTRERSYADEDYLDEFEQKVMDILEDVPDNICFPTDQEILIERSTTTSFEKLTERKMPQWEASFITSSFETEQLTGVRCKVPVYPGGLRDTMIADIRSNYSIRWIERSMRHILQHVEESAVCLLSSTFHRRKKNVVFQKGSHIFRDIKKCGLTYNSKDIFPRVKSCLEKKFPNQPWNRMDILANLVCIDEQNEVSWEMQRGYSLGFANHVVTLCNIAIHRMARDRLDRQFSYKLKAIVGNDDEDVVIFGYPNHRMIAEHYLECERDVHSMLGNLIHYEKSVIKPFGLFYEEYSLPGWQFKESLVCNALACAYLAPSIRVAKHYIQCQSARFESPWARTELERLARYWGKEFYDVDDELFINFEVGGWLDTRRWGLKTSLLDLDFLVERYDPRYVSIVSQTCTSFLEPPRPKFKTKGLVANHKYFGDAVKAPAKVQLYTITDKDLQSYYKELTTFQNKYSKRIANWSLRYPKAVKQIRTIQENLLSRAPWYCIPDSLVNTEEYWPCRDMLLNMSSEVNISDNNPINTIFECLRDNVTYVDPCETWNPDIPEHLLKFSIYVDFAAIHSASAFSNNGALPLLEYYNRKGSYCIAQLAGRQREPLPSTSLEKSASKVSFYKNVKKKRKKTSQKEEVKDPFLMLGYEGFAGCLTDEVTRLSEEHAQRLKAREAYIFSPKYVDPSDVYAEDAIAAEAELEKQEEPVQEVAEPTALDNIFVNLTNTSSYTEVGNQFRLRPGETLLESDSESDPEPMLDLF